VQERQKLFLVAGLVLLANYLDLWTTYLASPDLAHEWNVLERYFDLGWTGLIGAKLIGGWFALFGYAYYLRHRTACYPPSGVDQDAFCRHFTFGTTFSPGNRPDRIPSRRHLGVHLGYFWAGMQMLIFWVALDNYLLQYGISHPLRQPSETVYHLFQSILVASAVLLRFYLGNYRRYRRLAAQRVETIRPSGEAVVRSRDLAARSREPGVTKPGINR